MKKISLVLLTLSVVTLSAKSQVRFGVQAGANLGSLKLKSDGEDEAGKKSIVGYKLGAVASVPVAEQLSFMPELNIVQKGGKFSSSETIDLGALGKVTTDINSEIKPLFIEVPLNLAYSAADENGNGFFGGLGPVLSLGVGGKGSTGFKVTTVLNGNTTTTSESFKGKIKFDGKENVDDNNIHLKSFELGGNVFAGYRMSNGLFAKAFYSMGFSNLSPEANSSFKTSYFGVSLGYFFK